MNFFRIVETQSTAVGAVTRVSELGLFSVAAELFAAVAFGVALIVAVRILPSMFVKGVANVIHSSRLSTRHASPPPASAVKSAVVPSAVVNENDLAAESKKTPSLSQCPDVASAPLKGTTAATTQPPESSEVVSSSNMAASPQHVDIDALLDQFCAEEELMDDAFVDSVVSRGSHHTAPSTAAEAPKPCKQQSTTSVAAERRTTKEASLDVDPALARRMMRAFNDPKVGTADASKNPNAPSQSQQQPVGSVHIKSVHHHHVNLDDVFDEFQSTEELLDEALLDAASRK